VKSSLSFGRQLKRLRADFDLTQERLAEQVSCSVEMIQALESGRRRPSRQLAERLAGSLGIDQEQRPAFLRLARLDTEQTTHKPDNGRQTATAANRTTERRPPVQIPTPRSALIGRAKEVAQVAGRLTDPACRLLTVVGAGGAGKTRLALQVASDLADRAYFADGVGFVELAWIVAAEHVATAIADVLGCTLTAAQTPEESLLAFLREREMMLVLDNLEHLLQATPLIAAILRTAPGVRLLVTSRERLRLHAEWVFELGGLALPGNDTRAAIEHSDAVLLFLHRARHASSDFALTATNRPAIAHICHLLDGMPLAIELAASWVRALTLDEITAEVTHGLDFLQLSERDADPRHHSMRIVIDHSWALLTSDEQGVMARLSVFRGGCTREAAEAITGASLPTLVALLDKSLLRRGPTGRYEMHELVRQYAADHLAGSPDEEPRALDQHCVYYATFVSAREPAMKGPRQYMAVADIGAEIDNLRAAWQRAVEHRRFKLLRQMAVGATLLWFYEMRGWFQECETVCRRTVDALYTPPPEAREDKHLLAYLGAMQGTYAFRRNRPAEGLKLLAENLNILRQGGDPRLVFFPLVSLATFAFYSGEIERATELLDEVLAVARAIDDPWTTAQALVVNAMIFVHQQPELAYARIHAALPHIRAVGDRLILGPVLYYLGDVALALGNVSEAEEAFAEMLERSLEIDHRHAEVAALTGLARVACVREAWGEAITYALEAVAGSREIGESTSHMKALTALGEAEAGGGDHPAARHTFAQAITLAVTGGMAPTAIDAWAGLAALDARNRAQHGPLAHTLAFVRGHRMTRRDTAERLARLWSTLAVETDAQPLVDAEQAAKEISPDQLDRVLLAYAEGHAATVWQRIAPRATELDSSQPHLPAGGPRIAATGEMLSKREVEVLRLIASGANNLAIAQQLVISVHTVKTHVANILAKLCVTSRTEAALRARELGIGAP
jgi:predicted ATPase/DNA-binding NarL/FixJ family response regulator/DNA-binding XRE family transcriptional regulator